jgi:dehydrodolichyl diphosphate syntase complex subunit NUS1
MESAPVAPSHNSASGRPSSPTPIDQLQILLISAEDGRDSLVDLTKTLAEMAQKGKISSEDVTAELVNAELSESVMDEPQLLVLFGPSVELDGYPPWQVRLTEIYNVQDNNGVGYQVFLRALYNFADAQMRFGR